MLELTDVELRRGSKLLLEDAQLRLTPGQHCGLTGRNGCGKTSLFRLILGQHEADRGECRIPDDWLIAHVDQEVRAESCSALDFVLAGDEPLQALQAAISEAESIGNNADLGDLHAKLEAIDGYRAPARAAKLLAGLGFSNADQARAVAEFSGGWRMRLALARALMARSDLLLLDEPTNHLDLDAIIWLEQWLQQYPGALLLISHDRRFLNASCDLIAHIEQQSITLYTGNYDQFERQRAEKLAQQQQQYEKEQAQREHLQKFVDRFRAQATKAKQAQSRLKALERLTTSAPVWGEDQSTLPLHSGNDAPAPLMVLDSAQLGYPDRTIFNQISWSIEPGARLGILGRNGAGKSTLMKTLAGKLEPIAGERVRGRKLRIGYFAQHQLEQLHESQSPLWHLQQQDAKLGEQAARDYLGQFGFSGEMATDPVGPRSGGEKARLALGLINYHQPHLLLLDEPTNHLDMHMRDALAASLQEFEGAIALVSHDRDLLDACCDDYVLVNDGQLEDFKQGLEAYVSWLRERAREDEGKDNASASGNNRKAQRQARAQVRQQTKDLRRQLQREEKSMEQARQKLEQIEAKLADPDIYTAERSDEVTELSQERGDWQTQLEDAEMAWLELAEEIERIESELAEAS